MENLICDMCGANNRRIKDVELNAYKCARCRTVLEYITVDKDSDEYKMDWVSRVNKNSGSISSTSQESTVTEKLANVIKYFDSVKSSNYVFGSKLSAGSVKSFITNFPSKVESNRGYSISQLDMRLKSEDIRNIAFGMFDEDKNGKKGILVTDDILYINTDGKKEIIHFEEIEGGVTAESKSSKSRLLVLANGKTYKIDVEKEYDGVNNLVKLINCAIDYHISGAA